MRWEYTFLNIKDFKERIASNINSSDWELVAIYENNAYFKRLKPELPEKDSHAVEGYFGGKVG